MENNSEEAEPSDVLFSQDGHLNCNEPEEQTSPSKSSQDTSQEMNEVRTLDSEEVEDLTQQLQMVSETLRKFERKIANTKDVQISSDKVKAENAGLKKDVEDLKLKIHAEKQLRALADHNTETTTQNLKVKLAETERAALEDRTKAEWLEANLVFERAQGQKLQERLAVMEDEAKNTLERTQASHQAQLEEHREETTKIASALEKAEDLLQAEQFCWQQEKTSLLKGMEESRAVYEYQLDEQRYENSILVAALRTAEQKMESQQAELQEERTSLIHAREGFKKTVQEMQQEVKETLERYLASHQAQLEEHREEITKIASALEKAEDLLQAEQFCWQQEKTSLLKGMEESRAVYEYQLDEQRYEKRIVLAALRTAEQQMESQQVELQEERTSLIQATQGFKKTERSQASHQAQLEEHREYLCWQQEKTSLLEQMEESRTRHEVQLDQQKHENNELVAALNEVQQKLDIHIMQWQKVKTSLIRGREDEMKTVQDAQQQEKDRLERSIRHQVEWQEEKVIPRSGHKGSQKDAAGKGSRVRVKRKLI
ncbi:putative uncharacterized protein MYH16 [Sparus aurata]|uniref:putative uncharacterized protein MYH16 n=1 Tax=Sparus aurata TaxID=8175 RepID=UPI0011C1CAEA|nr:putative uncharacterized protein MYH16 [Sparus aurata]